MLRLAESAPSEQIVMLDPCLSVRVEHEGRSGRASGAAFDDAGIRRVVDAAWQAAQVSPRLDLPELVAGSGDGATGGDGGCTPGDVEALLQRDAVDKLDALADALADVRKAGAIATGFWDSTARSCSYATSAGCFRHALLTHEWFSSTVIADDGGSGVAHDGHVDGSRLEGDAAGSVIRRALDLALRSKNPRPVDANVKRVLLSSRAVSELLLFVSWCGFGARSWLEKRSFLRRHESERIMDEAITIVDDREFFRGIGFDFEGLTRQRVPLVENGVARRPVFDRPCALEAGGGFASTGHADRQPSAGGPSPSHLRMLVDDAKQVPPAALTEALGDGLVITQFHYTNLIDPVQVSITGMTRNGTFLVEDGRVVGPVRNLRFTVDVLDVLSEIVAASSQSETVLPFFGDAASSVPALVLPAFRFTSTTDF